LRILQKQPKHIADESALYEFAVKALTRRGHSVHELWQALQRKCSDADIVKRVVARLREAGYLDDARYARQFARQHREARKQGRFRIQRELRARGVPDAHIEAALAEVFAGTDEAAMVRQLVERKLKLLRGPLDPRKMASLYASLLRKGFPSDVVRRELRSRAKHAAELPDPDGV
jgi:regulatory protein